MSPPGGLSHACAVGTRSYRCLPRAYPGAIAFAKSCQVEWPNNALRHSYATYRLAAIANAARVALEMGNSPQKLMTNYRELANEEEAQDWFSISPDRPANIIAVPGQD